MLFKYTERDIPGKGKGIVTLEFIPKDTLVFRLTPENSTIFLSRAEVEKHFASLTESEVEHFAYHAFTAGGKVISLTGDGSLINHDDNPNTVTNHDTGFASALRDIYPGEEITENYLGYDDIDWYFSLLRERGLMNDQELVESFRKSLADRSTDLSANKN